MASIVDKGKAAGLIAGDCDPDTLFDMMVGTLLYRALFSLETPPADYVERVTHLVVDGAFTNRTHF